MGVVAETANRLPHGLNLLTATYRQRVFVEHLGWQFVAVYDGMEQDQFDHSDALYVVARDEVGDVCGCVRLLPTICLYLLSEAFPQLLNGALPSRSPEVWELSRFMAMLTPIRPRRQHSLLPRLRSDYLKRPWPALRHVAPGA